MISTLQKKFAYNKMRPGVAARRVSGGNLNHRWLLPLRAVTVSGIAALLFTTSSGHAAQLSLATGPLYLASSVDPNVMILIDTSSSMTNLIWANDFNSANEYPDWDYNRNNWNDNSGFVAYSGIPQGGCASGWKSGKNSAGTERCLKLPLGNGLDSTRTRYTGRYLNYLFETYASNTDLTTGSSAIPTDYRINVARTVASSLVNSTPDVRFGYAVFGSSTDSYDEGASIGAACGSGNSTVATSLSAIPNPSWSGGQITFTPLAEAYYEITRYFRGMTGYYNSSTTYTSPIQYRCQKNFVVVVTDGFPTQDSNFPTNDSDDVANTSASLPNWDGLAPATTSSMYPNFPQYSDGHGGGGEGDTLYLDDLAKFGYDTDMRKTGNDLTGKSFNASDYPTQNLQTYTIGFALSNQMLQDAATYGHGQYYTATNASELSARLQATLSDIANQTSTASAVAVNSRSLNTETRIYQALFTSGEWGGNIKSLPINTTTGDVTLTPDWEAKTYLTVPATTSTTKWDTGRAIITKNATQGIPFRWVTDQTNDEALTTDQIAVLNTNPVTNASDTLGEERLKHLRGYRCKESANPCSLDTADIGSFRNRVDGNVLGDIVNSTPIYVGPPGAIANVASSHKDFRNTHSGRQPILYVGANDGMLHAFDASNGTDMGKELLAYVPSLVFRDTASGNAKLNQPTRGTGYEHTYFVDAAPTVGDAYGTFNNVLDASDTSICSAGCWRTVLVGGLGGGGKGVYALDITDPSGTDISELAFSEANAKQIVLWEFNDGGSGNMGYVYGQPTITRVKTSATGTAWVAIFANGYNSTDEKATLYIVYLDTGATMRKIVLTNATYAPDTSSTGNGLSTPAVVDKNGDNIADYVYAGDLRGNLWKISLTDNNPANWSGDVLFNTGGAAITSRPEIGDHPASESGLMVYFGTGRYVAATDNTPSSSPVHAFYGIWDKDQASVSTVSSSRLVVQNVTTTATTADKNNDGDTTDTGESFNVRTVSNYPITTWGDTGSPCESDTDGGGRCMGWKLTLPTDVTTPYNSQGEMVVSNPVLLGGALPRIIFTTLIPQNTQCSAGGTSWLMELNPINGGQLNQSVFDINVDGVITDDDLVSGTRVSGVESTVGIMPEPVIVRDSANKRDLKITPGSTGSITSVKNYVGQSTGGRQSWRQLK
jgi:type IV pilus assembly protein PilY1